MLRDILFASVFALTVILFVVDHLIATADPETPTKCAEEDVPVVRTPPAVIWFVDKDGKLRARKQ